MRSEVDFPYACILGIGDLGQFLIDRMESVVKNDGIAFMHLNEFDLQASEALQESDLLFIIFHPSIGEEVNLAFDLAGQARAAGILTVGICCIASPIGSGPDKRWQILEQVRANMDTLAIVASTKDLGLGFQEYQNEIADSMASECQSIVCSLSYIFSHKSFVGIDFEDVRGAVSGSGYGAIGTGHAQGSDRGVAACANAIEDLTSKGIDLCDVRGCLVKISGHHVSLNEFSDVMEQLEPLLAADRRTVVTAYWEDLVDDESLSVSLLVSGLTRDSIATLACQSETLDRKAS